MKEEAVRLVFWGYSILTSSRLLAILKVYVSHHANFRIKVTLCVGSKCACNPTFSTPRHHRVSVKYLQIGHNNLIPNPYTLANHGNIQGDSESLMGCLNSNNCLLLIMIQKITPQIYLMVTTQYCWLKKGSCQGHPAM
jgi:hypothetical protein